MNIIPSVCHSLMSGVSFCIIFCFCLKNSFCFFFYFLNEILMKINSSICICIKVTLFNLDFGNGFFSWVVIVGLTRFSNSCIILEGKFVVLLKFVLYELCLLFFLWLIRFPLSFFFCMTYHDGSCLVSLVILMFGSLVWSFVTKGFLPSCMLSYWHCSTNHWCPFNFSFLFISCHL